MLDNQIEKNTMNRDNKYINMATQNKNNGMNTIYLNLIMVLGYLIIIGTQYTYEDELFEWSTEKAIPALQKVVEPDSASWWMWHSFTHYIAGGVL